MIDKKRLEKFADQYKEIFNILYEAAKKENISMFSLLYLRDGDQINDAISKFNIQNTGIHSIDMYWIREYIDDFITDSKNDGDG